MPDSVSNHASAIFLTVAVILTLGWLVLGVWVLVEYPPDPYHANAFGDWAAGTLGGPAIIWIVIGFFLQRSELKLQREELTTAREALQAQFEEMKLLHAEATKTTNLLEEQSGPQIEPVGEVHSGAGSGRLAATFHNRGPQLRDMAFRNRPSPQFGVELSCPQILHTDHTFDISYLPGTISKLEVILQFYDSRNYLYQLVVTLHVDQVPHLALRKDD